MTPPSVKAGTLQEMFNLEEGPVTATFPANLSPTSYADLKDYFDLFLRKAKRRAESGPAASDDIPPMGNLERDSSGTWKPKGQT